MNLSEAQNFVIPSALANRVKELLEQSKRYQGDLARVSSELEQIQRNLAALAPKVMIPAQEAAG